MKGIVFTEYIDFLDNKFGMEKTEEIIQAPNPESTAAYTVKGNYPYQEMLDLLRHSSTLTNEKPDDLLVQFGQHMIRVFHQNFPQFFDGKKNAIHPEVQKLYPDADLPSFDIENKGDDFIMTYHSRKGMGDFAHGLIMGCLDMYRENAKVEKTYLKADKTVVQFKISKIDR